MALIVCPHCGKSVSDTVDVCIHCGKSIHTEEKAPEPPKRYEKLNSDEQNALFQQFSREYPEYIYPQGREQAAKKRRIARISGLISGALGAVFLFVRILVAVGAIKFSTEGNDFIIPGIFLLLALVTFLFAIIIWAIFNQSAKKSMHRFLLFAKLYKSWLSARAIKYTVGFKESEEKYKKYFNNINPTLYMKEV